MDERQKILRETVRARDRAQALLKELLDARSLSEEALKAGGQSDLYKQVTGKSSLENAIASAQRMVETCERQIQDFRQGLSPEDAAVLDEVMRK
ncbi:MAG: hypothetical protein SFY95_05465 [Planctomycetota bacterium]|nr:hypothetical protein [Planctomycetota bacterium]